MRRIIQIAVLVLSSIVLALGVSEVVVRLVGVEPNPNPRLRFHPTLGWTLDPKWGQIDHVRPDGFRHTAPASPRDRRLIILGDSFAVGGQLPFRETFAGLLTSWLDGDASESSGGAGDRWDVVNLGVSGWGTGQQLIALREFGLEPRPDAVVLVVFPYNDLCNTNIEQAFTCSILDFHRPYFILDRGKLQVTSLHPTRARLRRLSRLFAFTEVALRWGFPAPRETPDLARKERLQRRREVLQEQSRRVGLVFDSNLHSLVPEPEQPQVIRAGWKITERIIAEMKGALDQQGIPLIPVVVPYADTFDVDWVAGQRRKGRPVLADHATATIESVLSDLEVPVISVRQRISASELDPHAFFHPRKKRNDRHFSEFGHLSVAGWILDELRAIGLTECTARAARPPSDQSLLMTDH
jgi:hypothetical protein